MPRSARASWARARLPRARRVLRDAAGRPGQPPLRQPDRTARADRAVDAGAGPARRSPRTCCTLCLRAVRVRRQRRDGRRRDERARRRGGEPAGQVDHVRAARHVERGRADRRGGRHARRASGRGRARCTIALAAACSPCSVCCACQWVLELQPGDGRGAAAAVRAAAEVGAADRRGRVLRGVRGGREPGLVGGLSAGQAGHLGRASPPRARPASR